MRIREMCKKIQKDDKGSGIVMVMITVAFLGLITGMLMFASYGGYKMKLVDKQNKNTFYTVESVLDEINIGLQKKVSVALAEAYKDVMVNYALYENPAKRSESFYNIYYEKLKEELDIRSGKGSMLTLRSFVKSPELIGDGVSDVTNSKFLTETGFATYGAVVEGKDDPNTYVAEIDDTKGTGLALRGIKVSYVSKTGALAMVETDIRIQMPRLNFADSSAFPDLNNFINISNGEYLVECKGTGKINVKGNVYSDSMNIKQTPGLTKPVISFMPATDAESDESGLIVVQNDITAVGGEINTDNMDLWATNIDIDNSDANFSGKTYVKNDLILSGKDSNVTLAGEFNGFGISRTEPDKSSAILINGRNSSLDLSQLKSMIIGGNAYIGTAFHTGDKNDNGEETQNKTDVLMGESIAVKSDQLAYLVPPEVVGVIYNYDGTPGNSKYASNPMTMAQYNELKTEIDNAKTEGRNSKYLLYDRERNLDKLNGHSISYYNGVNDPIVIFKTTNADPLVYFYMNFESLEKANEYFRDYYGVNKLTVDKYTKLYADNIKINDPENFLQLQMGGNAMAFQAGVSSVIPAASSTTEIDATGTDLELKFTALNKKLVTNIEQLNRTEIKHRPYENIIDSQKILDVLKKEQKNSLLLDLKDASSNLIGQVLITKEMLTNSIPANVKLVISEGDVVINSDFHGNVIAKGNVKLVNSGAIDLNVSSLTLEEFTEMLLAKNEHGTLYAIDFFRDGINYQHSENKVMDHGTENVSMADLIVFENWSKK